MTWTATPTTTRRSRLRLALTAAIVVLAAVTASTASVTTAAAVEASTAEVTLLAAAPAQPDTSPRTPVPGFLRQRGRFTKFDAPDAVIQTAPFGINNRGTIVGKYNDAEGLQHGFRRDARGRFVTIDFPGARETQLTRINDRGWIVGRYETTPPDPGRRFRGFLRQHDGELVMINYPGAISTQPLGINNRGQVVGQYVTPDGTSHGFRWERGRFATIDRPGAAATALTDINDQGLIVGAEAGDFSDPASIRPFLLERGRFTTLPAFDARVTYPFYDINNRGQIAGSTLAPTDTDELAGARGFLLARGANGPITPIDVPGAPRNLVSGLNDAGAIVGQYENTSASASTQQDGSTPLMNTPDLQTPEG
jgi:probable HAF family extracellular repeat protein/YD repeat-containing protein